MAGFPFTDSRIAASLAKNNIHTPTPIQHAVLSALGTSPTQNIFASSKTGTGKTLAFCIPLVHRALSHPAEASLILSPTRELALQTSKTLSTLLQSIQRDDKSRIYAVSVIGGLAIQKQHRQLSKKPSIVVATPGRLHQLLRESSTVLHLLQHTTTVVVDEADRLFESGCYADLQPIYKALPPAKHVLVFSATLQMKQTDHPLSVLQRITNIFSTSFHTIDLSPDTFVVEHIVRHITYTTTSAKIAFLLSFLADFSFTRILLFTNTIDTAKRLSQILSLLQQPVVCIHRKIDQKTRLDRMDSFRQTQNIIAVCTDVAARGLDIPQVGLVVNFDLPRDCQTYVHRVGRTSRAGLTGHSLDLITPSDETFFAALQQELSISVSVYHPPARQLNSLQNPLFHSIQIAELEHLHKTQSNTATPSFDTQFEQAETDAALQRHKQKLQMFLKISPPGYSNPHKRPPAETHIEQNNPCIPAFVSVANNRKQTALQDLINASKDPSQQQNKTNNKRSR